MVLATISKALPIVTVMFSSLGVWLMESSPINSRELSEGSFLKTLIVPFGKAIPRPFDLELRNFIVLLAGILF
jgi:hypothetical protein